MWCQSSRDPSENSHYMIIPAHTPHYAFNLPILYRILHVFARIQYKSSTIANIIQNTRKLCKDVIFLNAPRSALIHREDDYVGQIMQENDSRAAHYAWHYAIHTHHFALCYTHTLLCIMQLGNSGLWCQVVWREERDLHIRPILNPGACIGSIYPYWQLCAKNYMAWSLVIPSDQFKTNCCHLMCMAIRA